MPLPCTEINLRVMSVTVNVSMWSLRRPNALVDAVRLASVATGVELVVMAL